MFLFSSQGMAYLNKYWTVVMLQTLLLLAAETAALSAPAVHDAAKQPHERPLLRRFGDQINERVRDSKSGVNRFGSGDHYTSGETIPCLDMQCVCDDNYFDVSSRREIREAYTAGDYGTHGRSSGSGCCIIRLQGQDADAVRELGKFAEDFFEGVDDDDRNSHIKSRGVFRIANNVHAGFDHNVNEMGKMQVLYTKLIPGQTDEEDPMMLPLEVGELVGTKSLSGAHSGMSSLFNIGSQITSAVLGMDSASTNKLLDDCSRLASDREHHDMLPGNADAIADNMSNSYQRIIRYLKPQPSAAGAGAGDEDTAFWPHVDSTFLTLIPMPEIAGLEVWCPSARHAENEDLSLRGEWVRPIMPTASEEVTASEKDDGDCTYVVALAGEFLQLLSNGQVPTCIHRVIAPKAPAPSAFGFTPKNYKPRVSAPLFLRPRRGEEAVLNVGSDLREPGKKGLYFEEGLLEECNSMRVWDYMDCMSPEN